MTTVAQRFEVMWLGKNAPFRGIETESAELHQLNQEFKGFGLVARQIRFDVRLRVFAQVFLESWRV